jgi:hypothetical protein
VFLLGGLLRWAVLRRFAGRGHGLGREDLDRGALEGDDECVPEREEAMDRGRGFASCAVRRTRRRERRRRSRGRFAADASAVADVAAGEVAARAEDDERPFLGCVAIGLRREAGRTERRCECMRRVCHGESPSPFVRGDRVVRRELAHSVAVRHWHAFPPRRRTSELRRVTQREWPKRAPPVRRRFGKRSACADRVSARIRRKRCVVGPLNPVCSASVSAGRHSGPVGVGASVGVGVLFGHASLIGRGCSGAPQFVRCMFSQTEP